MNHKITCMCITHNRVHLLKRSMKCFTDQTYANKELVILHTFDDTQTANFSQENNANYRRLRLTNLNNVKGYSIENVSNKELHFSEIEKTGKVSLKSREGRFLSKKPRNKSFTENDTCARHETFFMERTKDYFTLKTASGQWLCLDGDENFSVSDTEIDTSLFKAIIKVNTEAILKHYSKISDEDTLIEEGWKIEELNDVESNITIIEVHSDPAVSLGSKRNLVLRLAKGDYICVWDDDDWYDNNRLKYQIEFARFMKKPASALISTFLYDHHTHNGYIAHPREDGWEPTLLCLKSEFGLYSNLNKREDTPVLKKLFMENKLAVMDEPLLYIYNIHTANGNTCSSEHFLDIVNSERTENADQKDVEYVRGILGIENPLAV